MGIKRSWTTIRRSLTSSEAKFWKLADNFYLKTSIKSVTFSFFLLFSFLTTPSHPNKNSRIRITARLNYLNYSYLSCCIELLFHLTLNFSFGAMHDILVAFCLFLFYAFIILFFRGSSISSKKERSFLFFLSFFHVYTSLYQLHSGRASVSS